MRDCICSDSSFMYLINYVERNVSVVGVLNLNNHKTIVMLFEVQL